MLRMAHKLPHIVQVPFSAGCVLSCMRVPFRIVGQAYIAPNNGLTGLVHGEVPVFCGRDAFG
jgi:hypothetical protein